MNGVERKGGTLHLLIKVILCSKVHPNKVTMLRNEDTTKLMYIHHEQYYSHSPQSLHVHQFHDLVVM